ncbi:PREDICTED: BTB/POZ domain-containing protein 17 [Mandrillus leucophaeus]|uniref:BTB/POZ domain-containing protein 17 n=1 Tax=Mandrillus leucophaeus TaxID=9568 RepID=UPI0005F53BEB|nr:PREDICTED: BTB/POZ domain-containing protein 17 [Mandrillus leucophaeus]
MPRRGYSKPGSWGSFWAMLTLVGLVTRAAQRADVGGEAAGTSINHSQAVLQRLQELLRQGNASDVVLRVQAAGTDEVRVFHAHRLLLGLHSELFRELLSNQSEAVLQEPRDCAAVFDKFIRYLYCGELTVLLTQAIPLHRLATKYGVASLQRGVADYMRGRLLVRHAYSFHQSSEEAGDFLAHADLQRRNSEYLVENALHLHLIVKPVYHTLIRTPK